jgi:hypothetical protein
MLLRDYFGSKLSKEYDPLLDESGRNSLTEIKRYFSKSKLIKDIRDNFAFHYPAADLRKQLQRTNDNDTLYIYLEHAHGNSFYSFADVLVGSTMLSKVQGADPQKAMDTLFGDPINAIRWFLDFIGSCMIILVEKYLGTSLEALTPNTIEVLDAKRWKDVHIPFFLEDEN